MPAAARIHRRRRRTVPDSPVAHLLGGEKPAPQPQGVTPEPGRLSARPAVAAFVAGRGGGEQIAERDDAAEDELVLRLPVLAQAEVVLRFPHPGAGLLALS